MAVDFGELSEARTDHGATSDGSRGVFGGGEDAGILDTIDFLAIGGSGGTALAYGELTEGRKGVEATSNGSRGVFHGGTPPTEDTIDYITIATVGNAIDFGNLTVALSYLGGT